MAYPWFRLYSEMLSDRKLARAARLAGCERATAVGVWVGMMCLASESSERGKLLLAPGVPFSGTDIAEEVGCGEETVAGLLDAFARLEMVAWEGDALAITHWGERQYESDKSTARVRKHRARKKQGGNVSETLPERSRNAPDTDSDTDTESDQTQNHHHPAPQGGDDDDDDDRPAPPPPGSKPGAWERWQATLGGRGALDRQDCAARVGAYGEPAVIEAIERMREQPRERWCLKYVDVTLDNLAEESRPPPEPPPINEPQTEREEPVAEVPWWGDFATRVRGAVAEQVFELYLARALPVAYSDSVLVLGIGDAYGKEWCENRLYKAIQRAASEAAGRSVSVRFIVLGNRRAPPGVAMGEAATVAVEAT